MTRPSRTPPSTHCAICGRFSLAPVRDYHGDMRAKLCDQHDRELRQVVSAVDCEVKHEVEREVSQRFEMLRVA